MDHVDGDDVERDAGHNQSNGDYADKEPRFQNGVLRTNCIDCLDRTNVAQFAYGLAALGHQLHALNMIDVPKIDLDSQLANNLMGFYEKMADTLAHQYGGSAAHNKVSLLLCTFDMLLYILSLVSFPIGINSDLQSSRSQQKKN